MADTETEFPFGHIDVRRNNKGQETGATNKSFTAQAGLAQDRISVGGLRSFLSGNNAGYYTTARLNQMTKNDMAYAARLISDPSGIK